MKLIRKFISIVLSLIILCSMSVVGSVPASAASITTMYIEGSGVGVRTGAGTEFPLIERVNYISATVINTTPTTDSKGQYQWYNVTYHNGTKQITGWVAYDPEYIRLVTYNPDDNQSEQITAFPESYQSALKLLSAAYPNWKFVPDPVSTPFPQSVEKQLTYKQVQFDNNVSWRSMGIGAYDWNKSEWIVDNGGWTGASREMIAYYLDPRNFLETPGIFMFLKHNEFSDSVTEAQINNMIAGTFMANGYPTDANDPYGGSYAKLFIAAGKSAGFNPCVIVAKIIQEQGRNGSSMTSGTYSGANGQYYGYYNFFNVSASGSTSAQVIQNGLAYAQRNGWDTVYKSIMGGASFLNDSYISRGQNTYYYQDFQVHNTGTSLRQYAQAVHDAYSKGSILSSAYVNDSNTALTFVIPVFVGLPDSKCIKPAGNSKMNNYYFLDLSVSGLTPSFSMYQYSYNLQVTKDTAIKYAIPNGASLASANSFSLKKGTSTVTLTVKAESGYTTDYTITVNATTDCTLYITLDGLIPGGSSNTPTPPTPPVVKGDTNGDNQITLRDLANVRLHLLGLISLNGADLTGADTNGDSQITLRDLANVRLHLLGLINLT